MGDFGVGGAEAFEVFHGDFGAAGFEHRIQRLIPPRLRIRRCCAALRVSCSITLGGSLSFFRWHANGRAKFMLAIRTID